MSTIEDSSEVKPRPQQEEQYTVYGYRYIVSIVYVFAACQNILMWLIFGPLQTNLQTVYGESLSLINFATILISNVSYIPSNFLATYVLDTYGLRFGTICGGVLTAAGLWVRCLCKEGFIFIFIGQCIAGIAQPFFYSSPQKISSVWFGANQRTMATTVISISLNIGNALGAFMPQFFVNINEPDPNVFKGQLQNMMICTAIAGSIALLVTILFFKEKPPTAPSKSATATKLNYIGSLKGLIKDKNAMLFIIASASTAGGIVTYSSVMQQLVNPFNINGDQVGNIIFAGVFVGFFGAGAVGFYANKTKKFKLSIIFVCAVSAVILMVNYIGALSGNVYLYGALVCGYIFFVTPLTPLGLELGVELSFPVAEATSGGLWFVFNQLLSTGESLIVDTILDNTSSAETGALISFIFMFGYQVVSLLLLFFVKENLKRSKYEKAGLLEHSDMEGKLPLAKPFMSFAGSNLQYNGDVPDSER